MLSELKSGSINSYDLAWFSNENSKEILVFNLHTDYHRLYTFHFLANDIPKDLLTRIELFYSNGQLASEEDKMLNFQGLINFSTQVSSNYFRSNKGFQIGDSNQKALTIYGRPDSQSTIDSYEKLVWNFVGDITYDGTELYGKPLAKDSFGHQVTMYFKNNKLVAMILFNDMP
jgi:hypothetical protein